MATVTGVNIMNFPAGIAGPTACGALIVMHSDGSSVTTIAPGSDGTMPPGISAAGATVLANGAALPAAPAMGSDV